MSDSRRKRVLPIEMTAWGLVDKNGRLACYLDKMPAIRPTRKIANHLSYFYAEDRVVRLEITIREVT